MWIISVTDVYSGTQEWSESIYKTILAFLSICFHFISCFWKDPSKRMTSWTERKESGGIILADFESFFIYAA